jgi:hypothetical protein
MDEAFEIPYLRIRFGWDSIVGLIPGIGDLVSFLFVIWIFAAAIQARAPLSVLLRMGIVAAVDLLIGIVPLLGDLFDLVWKSNQRNVALLVDWEHRPHHVARVSRWQVGAIMTSFVVIFVSLLGAAGWFTFWVLRSLWALLHTSSVS